MRITKKIISSVVILLLAGVTFAQSEAPGNLPVLRVDASKLLGDFKPINGVNGGPRSTVGVFDNSEYFNAFKPPFVRLHDVPFVADGAVDIHCIFPDFSADETDPANYNFRKTDLYIKSIIDVGSKVVFRLGESIEGGDPELFPKFYAHPPEDYQKWARICCNIIRHYNMGWANGFEWNIEYWEIWNEFNSRPECWSGTSEQYFELYEAAALAIKDLDANLKVGGPTVNNSVSIDEGRDFLAFCRDRKVPVDFVSWHGYANHPKKIMENIEKGIATVKEFGFDQAETIFDEWNYHAIPWGMKDRESKYNKGFKKTGGAPGASFTASVLGYMQNSDLDIACYYAAMGGIFRFGFFDIHGIPKKPFYTFVAYNQLIKCGTQVEALGSKQETGLGVVAAVNNEEKTCAVLLSNFEDETSRVVLDLKNIPIKDQLYCSEYVIDEVRSLDWDREQVLNSSDSQIIVELPKASVRLILLTPQSLERKPLNLFGEADRKFDEQREKQGN